MRKINISPGGRIPNDSSHPLSITRAIRLVKYRSRLREIFVVVRKQFHYEDYVSAVMRERYLRRCEMCAF